MNKDSAISTLGLSKIYKKKNHKVRALNEFSINIPKGSIYGLLGPNGAGKSTFINIIAGLVKKSSGKVTISGSDLDTDQIEIKKKIGIVPQELNIDPFSRLVNCGNYKRFIGKNKIEKLMKFLIKCNYQTRKLYAEAYQEE